MNRPKDDNSGPDLLDALQDIKDELRKEFDEKLQAMMDELNKRFEALEKKDAEQEEQIETVNKLFDRHEKSIEDLQMQIDQLKNSKVDQDEFDKESHELRLMIQALGTGKPVEIRAKTPTGPKITAEDVERWNSAADVTEKQELKIHKITHDLEELQKIKESIALINQKIVEFVTKDSMKATLRDVSNLKESMEIAQQDIE